MNIYEPLKGTPFRHAVKDAIADFRRMGKYTNGKIKFNDLLVPFNIDSNVDDVCIIYDLMHQLRSK